MNRRKDLIIAVLLVLSLAGLAQAEDLLLRDEWYVLEQQGIPGGFGNDQFFKTDEGYYYRGFFQVKMELLGTPLLVLEQIDAWVDEEFRLTKMLRVSDVDGAQTRHEAVFSYSAELTEATVTDLNTSGKTFTSYWNWEGVKPIYTSTSFVDKVNQEGGLVLGAEYTFDSWDSGEVTSVTLRVEAETTVIHNGIEIPALLISQEVGSLVMRGHMDDQGITYRTEAVGQNLLITKVDEDSIPELQAIAADVLMVLSNIVVEHPYRSIESFITVDWLDVPMEDFVWEDNRQKISRVLDENSVQLTICRDMRDFTGKVQLPVADSKLAPYLADTDFITPSSPVVQTLIPEILNEETDAWVATELIIDWVFNKITAKMVATTLTAEEILTSGEGKCTEYATLFATLARAAGLPTKIALGERYQGNIWVGHLWNEVWLGEWVSVDPSHNQASPDALLIKFIDSDTLVGTQSVRTGLVNKLNITIDDVQIADSESAVLLETGLVGTHYQNAAYSCEITMPDGWLGLESEEQGFPMLIMYDPGVPEFSVVLLMMSVPPGTKEDKLMDSRIMAMPSILPNYTLREQKTTLISGDTASVASWTFGDAPVFVQENQILVQDDVAYLFILSSPAETWDSYQGLSAQILGSFKTHR